MIFNGILASIAAIGVLCWLLFTLAVFALPLLAGVTVGAWAYGTGAGWPGAIAVGFVAGLVTLGVGQLLLVFVRPLWLRLAIAIAFVAPAAIAGYHATHGIVKHTMPSETWQIIISVLGAIAVGVTAFVRVTTMAGLDPPDSAWPAPKRIARRVGRARLACASSSSVDRTIPQSAYRRLDLSSPRRGPFANARQSAKLLAQHHDGECLKGSFASSARSDDPTLIGWTRGGTTAANVLPVS